MAAYLAATGFGDRSRRRFIYRVCQNQNLPADFLFRDYRLTPNLINFVVESLDNELGSSRGNGLSTRQKVLTSLKLLGSGSFQNSAKDNINIAQPTVSVVFGQFIDAMYARRNEYICMPNIEDQRRQKVKFYDIAGCPNVIGCIDGSLVPIQKPSLPFNEALYINRKKFHSLNIQVLL